MQDDNWTGRILRRPEVEYRTGMSRSSLYSWMAAGDFPRPLRLGARAVGWPESDIDAWMASRKKASSDGADAASQTPNRGER